MTPAQQRYEQTLDELAAELRRAPMTAREIKERFGCSLPIAYQRIKALKRRRRGERVYEAEVTRGTKGPKPIAYGVTGSGD
jgi:hypothetical protein